MMEIRHRAMACDFVVLIKDAGHDVDAAIAALESIDQIESRLTIYSRDSEISRLNDADSDVWTPLSRDTFELLCHAIELAHQTGGAFDVTSGPLVDVWGFTRRSGRKPSSTEIEVAIRSTGVDGIEMNEETRSARLTKPNMKLNLGAIGKGHAVDWLADQLLANGLSDFLIHAGQSSVFAWGDQFDDADQGDDVSPGCAEPARRGWMVGLAHPTKSKTRLAGIWLQDEALATSGSGKQYFHHRGRRYGHVIDPRTGQPAGDLLSLSLRKRRAADADALATALFVMGGADAAAWAEEREIPLLRVAPTRRQDTVRLEVDGSWQWAERPNTDATAI